MKPSSHTRYTHSRSCAQSSFIFTTSPPHSDRFGHQGTVVLGSYLHDRTWHSLTSEFDNINHACYQSAALFFVVDFVQALQLCRRKQLLAHFCIFNCEIGAALPKLKYAASHNDSPQFCRLKESSCR